MADVQTVDAEQWRDFVVAVDSASVVDPKSIDVAVEAYRNLPGRQSKAKGRQLVDDMITVARADGATSRLTMLEDLSRKLRIPTDPEEKAKLGIYRQRRKDTYVELVNAIHMAFGLIVTNPGDGIEELLEEGWLDGLQRDNAGALLYRKWLQDDFDSRGPEPTVSEMEKKAAKISLGKAPANSGRPLSSKIARPRRGHTRATTGRS